MTEARGTGSAIIAVVTPFVVAIIGGIGFAVIAGGVEEFARILQEGGWSTYASIAAGALVTLVIAICGFSIARGHGIPLAIPGALAMLPWLIGLAGMMVGLQQIEAVLGMVDPAEVGRILVVGVGECFSARVVGAYGSTIALAGLALSLLAASLAARERRALLLTGSGLAAAAAIFALADCLAVLGLSRALAATAMVSPDMIATLLAAAIAEGAIWKMAMIGAASLLGGAAIAHVAVGFAVRPSPGRIADAIMLSVAILSVVGLDFLGAQVARESSRRIAPPPLAGGLEPCPAPRSDGGGRVDGSIGRAQAALADLGLGPKLQSGEPVGILLDRRLTRAEVARVFLVLEQAGVREVSLFGESRALSDEVMRALGDHGALVQGLAFRRGAVRVSTGLGMDERTPDRDLLSAEVNGGAALSVKPRPGSAASPLEMALDEEFPGRDGGGKEICLIMRGEATAADLMRAADAVALRDYRPVVLVKNPFLVKPD